MNQKKRLRRSKVDDLTLWFKAESLLNEEKIIKSLKRKIVDFLWENRILDEDEITAFFEDLDNHICIHDQEKNTNPYKIPWLGTQKELAELFIELFKKLWVAGLEYGNAKKFAVTLALCFELTQTKKKENSNLALSLYQLLKPQITKSGKYEAIYPQVYTTLYKPKFNEIKKKE